MADLPIPDIRAARRPEGAYAEAFADSAPRFTRSQALVEAERCLYCHDAPCATACPTGVGSSRVDLQACKLEYSIVSPK